MKEMQAWRIHKQWGGSGGQRFGPGHENHVFSLRRDSLNKIRRESKDEFWEGEKKHNPSRGHSFWESLGTEGLEKPLPKEYLQERCNWRASKKPCSENFCLCRSSERFFLLYNESNEKPQEAF